MSPGVLGNCCRQSPHQPPNVGFRIPRLPGTLSYALNASELISNGFYSGGTSLYTNFGGDLAYASTSVSHPFNVVYSGGRAVSKLGTAHDHISESLVVPVT